MAAIKNTVIENKPNPTLIPWDIFKDAGLLKYLQNPPLCINKEKSPNDCWEETTLLYWQSEAQILNSVPKLIKDILSLILVEKELPLITIVKYLSPAYQEGVLKYYRESWRCGFPITVLLGALQRHFLAHLNGEIFDIETIETFKIKKTHIGAVLFCLLSLYHTIRIYPGKYDDRDFLLKGGEIK